MFVSVWVNMTFQVEVNVSGLLPPAVIQVGGKVARMGMGVRGSPRASPLPQPRLPLHVLPVPPPALLQRTIQAWPAVYSAPQSVGLTCLFVLYLCSY